MAAQATLRPDLPDLSSPFLDHAPLPMATVEGATHIMQYVNPAFCQLIHKAREELIGKPFRNILPEQAECLTVLDRVHRTEKSESHTEQRHFGPHPFFSSYTIWPVLVDGHAAGLMIQVIETAPLHEKALAMNEALLLGALRQHELATAAHSSNTQLRTEVDARKQREHDAEMLTNEVSHRVKNNLQIVIGLLHHEVRQAAAPCVKGYEAMQARISAIAELYELISESSRGGTVAVDAYLREIARPMTESLLGNASDIKIEIEAQALDIDPDRAVPFGLLVNELATNAVKHAFPGGTGRIVLRVEQIGDKFELTVADNGVGMKDAGSADPHAKHGANYVAIFARQLGGTIAVSTSEGTGTTVRIRFPLRAATADEDERVVV